MFKHKNLKRALVQISGCLAIAITPAVSMAGPPTSETCVIDFEGMDAGETITELTVGSGISGCGVKGKVTVESSNTIFSKEAAIVFDSDCPGGKCSGRDYDLGSPNETFGGPGRGVGGEIGSPNENDTALGKIAILANDKVDSNNDGNVDDPDDADVPGEYRFNFLGVNNKGVTVDSIKVFDVEFDEGENPAEVTLLRKSGGAPEVFTVVDTGDNGVETIPAIGIDDVEEMVVEVKGSSGFAAITFTHSVEKRACWVTFGGFDSAHTGPEGQKVASFGGNVGPPPSGHLNVVRHTDGSHLSIAGAEVTSCERVVEYCPSSGDKSPGQPGGNKGFDINVLNFAGTGRLVDPDGVRSEVPVTGYLVDCGEPQGKKDRDPDQFHVFIDGELFVGDVLGGGNVQLHPPVPNR